MSNKQNSNSITTAPTIKRKFGENWSSPREYWITFYSQNQVMVICVRYLFPRTKGRRNQNLILPSPILCPTKTGSITTRLTWARAEPANEAFFFHSSRPNAPTTQVTLPSSSHCQAACKLHTLSSLIVPPLTSRPRKCNRNCKVSSLCSNDTFEYQSSMN